MSNLSYNELKEAFERTERLKDICEYITHITLLKPQKHDIIVVTCGPDIDIETTVECHKTLDTFLQDEGLECALVTLPNEIKMQDFCQDDGIEYVVGYIKRIMTEKQYKDFIYDEFVRLYGDDLK